MKKANTKVAKKVNSGGTTSKDSLKGSISSGQLMIQKEKSTVSDLRMFKGPANVYREIEGQLQSINSEYWKKNNVSKGDVNKELTSVLDLLVILENGLKNEMDKSLKNRIKNSPRTIKKTFKTFCNDFLSIYSAMFLNRKPDQAEQKDIETGFSKLGLPGCIGNLSRMNVVIDNNLTKTDRSVEVELWLDSKNYCWYADDIKEVLKEDADTQHLQTSLRTMLWKKHLLINAAPYEITKDSEKQNNYYFIVGDNMPSWNIFVQNKVEGRTRAGKRLKKIFNVEDERRSKYVRSMMDNFGILSDIPADFDLVLIVDIVKVCIILMNMFNRRSLVNASMNLNNVELQLDQNNPPTNVFGDSSNEKDEINGYPEEWELHHIEVGFGDEGDEIEDVVEVDITADKGVKQKEIVQDLKMRCERQLD